MFAADMAGAAKPVTTTTSIRVAERKPVVASTSTAPPPSSTSIRVAERTPPPPRETNHAHIPNHPEGNTRRPLGSGFGNAGTNHVGGGQPANVVGIKGTIPGTNVGGGGKPQGAGGAQGGGGMGYTAIGIGPVPIPGAFKPPTFSQEQVQAYLDSLKVPTASTSGGGSSVGGGSPASGAGGASAQSPQDLNQLINHYLNNMELRNQLNFTVGLAGQQLNALF